MSSIERVIDNCNWDEINYKLLRNDFNAFTKLKEIIWTLHWLYCMLIFIFEYNNGEYAHIHKLIEQLHL